MSGIKAAEKLLATKHGRIDSFCLFGMSMPHLKCYAFDAAVRVAKHLYLSKFTYEPKLLSYKLATYDCSQAIDCPSGDLFQQLGLKTELQRIFEIRAGGLFAGCDKWLRLDLEVHSKHWKWRSTDTNPSANLRYLVDFEKKFRAEIDAARRAGLLSK